MQVTVETEEGETLKYYFGTDGANCEALMVDFEDAEREKMAKTDSDGIMKFDLNHFDRGEAEDWANENRGLETDLYGDLAEGY